MNIDVIKRSIQFQKKVLNMDSSSFVNGKDWFFCFLFCFINIPVAMVVAIIMYMFKIYQEERTLFSHGSNCFTMINLYISGYCIFFITMFVFLLLSFGIGLPLRYVTTGSLEDVLMEMQSLSLKSIIEMMFCIILYQVSIFYIVCTKKEQGILKISKRAELLSFLFLSGFIFFFARITILENSFLQHFMYLLACVSLLLLPFLSIKCLRNKR